VIIRASRGMSAEGSIIATFSEERSIPPLVAVVAYKCKILEKVEFNAVIFRGLDHTKQTGTVAALSNPSPGKGQTTIDVR